MIIYHFFAHTLSSLRSHISNLTIIDKFDCMMYTFFCHISFRFIKFHISILFFYVLKISVYLFTIFVSPEKFQNIEMH